MEPTIGILIYDDVEELDFVGSWEVLTPSFRHLGFSSLPSVAGGISSHGSVN